MTLMSTLELPGRENSSGGESCAHTVRVSQWELPPAVFFDNYFTSISLMDKLFSHDTDACGTIRTNENKTSLPRSVRQKRCPRVESVFQKSRDIVVTAWKDNKVVIVASTVADSTELTTVRRRHKDGTRVEVPRPLCISLYNQYMGGVDHSDHLRGSNHIWLKGMKNYINTSFGSCLTSQPPVPLFSTHLTH